jgi:hypothetical protein
MNFESYTDCLLQAFLLHSKTAEILNRKKEIVEEVAYFHNYTPNTVLYIGFNPAMLVDSVKEISVTYVSKNVIDYLTTTGLNFNYIPENKLNLYAKKFDSVIALEEYFTFAEDDDDQKKKVADICNLATEYVITTCRDYKNQEFKDKEFSIPALIKNGKDNNIFLEFHDYHTNNRHSWDTFVYQIAGEHFKMTGPFARKAMFFKQLAKFSYDAGAAGFHIHKNLMYKSLLKKNYEHVISIRFENGS